QLLAQVRATALAAQDHQDLPFEQLIEALNPPRSLAHHPLLQVMLTWQNAPEGELALPGLQLLAAPAGGGATSAKFDLDLSLHEQSERIAGSFQYACALFEHASIERHAAQFVTLLQALVEDDSACVLRLPLLPAPEQAQLLAFNATEAAFDAELCIHQLFEQQARLRPEATALVFEQECLSYAALNSRANQLAHHLVALGVGPDTRVAICLPRSTEMVVALLATLKAGAAYVPLDPAYPAQRLAFMLEDCHPTVLLSRSDCAQALPASAGVPLLWLDAPHPDWLLAPQHDPAVPGLTPAHLAYVIYTSGSAGLPKGVMVTQRGVVKLVRSNGFADFDSSSRVAFAANPAFDASTLEIWAPLLNGGTLVVIDQATMLDQQLFAAALVRTRTNVLWLTVGLFNQYSPALSQAIAQLNYLIVGGDVLDVPSIAHVLDHCPPQHLLNGYGPTETTTFAATHEVVALAPQQTRVPIGRPIANTRIHILDLWGQPCPIGVAGELHIAGAGLARGYLNRPELTAERFVPDPFGAPGNRMYRSGDLARWRADGTLDFLGRNDHQVKIRGFRIELGEIEAALQACPGVRESVVLARQDGEHKRLVAYLVGGEESASPESLTPEALRAQLSTRLPEYMLPAAYV
ncbi:MAG: amino acid adenylation domain-containing protein, partial [Burkholderiales bacterium]|nr:amino acid adenylation domain-containing protein [Burkholderiales bacterium]